MSLGSGFFGSSSSQRDIRPAATGNSFSQTLKMGMNNMLAPFQSQSLAQNSHQNLSMVQVQRRGTALKMSASGSDSAETKCVRRVAQSLIKEMTDAEREEFNKLPFIDLSEDMA